MSPTPKHSRLSSIQNRDQDASNIKLPSFGSFKHKSKFGNNKQQPLNFNKRKLTSSSNMKLGDQFSPIHGKKLSVLQLNIQGQRKVESAFGNRGLNNSSYKSNRNEPSIGKTKGNVELKI